MSTIGPDDSWAAGDAYEVFMGRWSRRLARDFVRWLDPAPRLDWLDVGCGTGALTSAICELADPASVLACDPSEAFVQEARRRTADARVTVTVAGSDDLPEGPDRFDCVVSGLVLNFIPDPNKAVEEMRRRTRPGGVVSAYVWDYADGMQFLRAFWDEAIALDDGAQKLDEGERFPICRPEALEGLFAEAGMREVSSGALEIPTHFGSFEDFWRPFLGGTGPAPSYVSSLSEADRAELEGRLERRLASHEQTGAIALTARAWVARGTA